MLTRLQDDLLEHTCPSPTYPGNHNETLEYDTYDYFNVDLEYLSDSYFDHSFRSSTGTRFKKQARNYRLSPKQGHTSEPSVQGPVVWRSQISFRELPIIKALPKRKPFALLQDWRERFHKVKAVNVILPESTRGLAEEEFNVDSLQSFAKLLVGDSLETLKADLVARGLDPDAIQVVLNDLLSGRDRDFAESYSGDDEEVNHNDDDDDDDYDEATGGEEEGGEASEGLKQPIALKANLQSTSDAVEATQEFPRHGRTRLQAQNSAARNQTNRGTSSQRESEAYRSQQKPSPMPDEPVHTQRRRPKRGREDHSQSDTMQTKRKRFTRT